MSNLARIVDDPNIFKVGSFELESGDILHDVPVAYKTWGTLSQRRDNVLIICHGFTGNPDIEEW